MGKKGAILALPDGNLTDTRSIVQSDLYWQLADAACKNYMEKGHRIPFSDTSPGYASGNFGYNAERTYYYQDLPTMDQLYNCARSSPLGFRLTYGLGQDVYANKFSFVFPYDRLAVEEVLYKNKLARQHLNQIGYFDATRLACSFDYEQGDALLFILREGDAEPFERKNLKEDPVSKVKYVDFSKPPDLTKRIVRVEPINQRDYVIPTVGDWGQAEVYFISFYSEKNMKMQYRVHKDRCIRWRSQQIDYDPYRGQSKLKASFAALQVINNLERSAYIAANRWALGLPVIYTKGVRKENTEWIKSQVGNPENETWMMLPSEFINKIESLGLNGSMMDLPRLIDMEIDLICAGTSFPKSVLMGHNAGIIQGSEVNIKEFFALLENEHALQNTLHRKFFAVDPEMLSILGNMQYEIDWGLRQVMTEQEKADIMMRKVQNAAQMGGFLSLNEIRAYLEYPAIEKVMEAKTCEKYYGVKVEELGQFPPSLGTWKQQTMGSILQTPEEEEQIAMQKANQELQGNKTEQAVSASSGKNPRSPSIPRLGQKMEKQSSGGDLEKSLAAAQDQLELTLEDRISQTLTSMQKQLNQTQDALGAYKAAESIGMTHDRFYQFRNAIDAQLKELKAKKVGKKDAV